MKDHNEMQRYIEDRLARGLDTPELDGREVLDLLEEINIADKIIAERDRLIRAIPACPVHGQCVPHAIEWVEKSILMMRMLKAESDRLATKIETIRWLLGSSVPSDEQLDIAIDAANRKGEQP